MEDHDAGLPQLAKCPSGIEGLDDVTGGGLPRGRPTLICGGAGCGKTLFAMEFLVRGVVDHGKMGSSSRSRKPLRRCRQSPTLGFDLDALVASNRILGGSHHVSSAAR